MTLYGPGRDLGQACTMIPEPTMPTVRISAALDMGNLSYPRVTWAIGYGRGCDIPRHSGDAPDGCSGLAFFMEADLLKESSDANRWPTEPP